MSWLQQLLQERGEAERQRGTIEQRKWSSEKKQQVTVKEVKEQEVEMKKGAKRETRAGRTRELDAMSSEPSGVSVLRGHAL